jgi:CheY-like chemotaxis protein
MAEILPGCGALTFSPQSSVAYFLKGVLDCAGLTVSGAFSNLDDLEAAVGRSRPDAIIYDVSFPFAANWEGLREARSRPVLRDLPFVVTTSEARELFRATGCSSAIEIFSRPDDVASLSRALRGAIEAVAPGHAA